MTASSMSAYLGAIVLASAVGGLVPMLWHRREGILRLFISFGAGVLIATAFLHMVPEAAGLSGDSVGGALLLGFLVMYVTEKFIMTHPCEAEHCDYHRIGWAAFAGLSLHSFVDGVAVGSSALVPLIGPIVAVAILLHKLPASVALSGVLLKAGFGRTRTEAAVLLFGAMVPLGAVLTFWVLKGVHELTLGYLIAFSAGTFIHISTDDLMPQIHRVEQGRFSNLASFGVGLALVWVGRTFAG